MVYVICLFFLLLDPSILSAADSFCGRAGQRHFEPGRALCRVVPALVARRVQFDHARAGAVDSTAIRLPPARLAPDSAMWTAAHQSFVVSGGALGTTVLAVAGAGALASTPAD